MNDSPVSPPIWSLAHRVRLALDEYRNGHITEAMERLDRDDRIVVATDWEELLDTMAADWFVDHQRHTAGDAAVSKMIAERNSDRHALNRRAQTLLRADGRLGAPVEIGDVHNSTRPRGDLAEQANGFFERRSAGQQTLGGTTA